jgi:hypothetical protein
VTLRRYLYEQRQYHDLLQLGASSASAQRELEALLQADKNARRLAWVNEINARKYTYVHPLPFPFIDQTSRLPPSRPSSPPSL